MPAAIEKSVTLAIDLGATNLRAGLVSLSKDGEVSIINQVKASTVADDKEKLVSEVLSLAHKAVEEHPEIKFSVIGVSACGIIEKDRVAVSLPNLKVKDIPLADILEKEFPGTKCRVANDANCAALSEATMGATRDVTDSIFVTISSGIGTGFVYDHKLINFPFEGGRIIQGFEDEKYVEAEEYLSGNGLARLMKKEGLGDHDGAYFFQRVREKDPAFAKTYGLWLEHLGLFFGNLQRIFSVDRYVLSGGVMKSKDVFLADLEKVANGFVHPYPLKPIKFVEAKFGQDAGLMGAASLGFSLL